MKKNYEAPLMEIISIEIEDVVLTGNSGPVDNSMNYGQGTGMGDLDLFKTM